MTLDHCLATYGTLAPGRANHHQLAGLEGRWFQGQVRGHLVARGWAAEQGYPALVPDDDGPAIEVWVFISADLPAHWSRLDAFEGSDYRRAEIRVQGPDGPIKAWIYLDAGPAGRPEGATAAD